MDFGELIIIRARFVTPRLYYVHSRHSSIQSSLDFLTTVVPVMCRASQSTQHLVIQEHGAKASAFLQLLPNTPSRVGGFVQTFPEVPLNDFSISFIMLSRNTISTGRGKFWYHIHYHGSELIRIENHLLTSLQEVSPHKPKLPPLYGSCHCP